MKNKLIVIFIIFFAFLSITSIYSASSILPDYNKYIYIKQGIWYLIGIILIIVIYKLKRGFFYKYDNILYFIGNILLILVLIFGEITNGSKAWFNIPGLGSFQPSELMKIALIIILSNKINSHESKTFKDETFLIMKCLLITLIPSILTFLEPDTGNVIIFFIILISIIFIHGIKRKWYIISLTILSIGITSLFLIYKYNNDLFLSIFGTNIVYRMQRIFDWKNNEGMQLENALTAIGSSPKNGYGLGNTPIYIPEAHTDFISAVIFSNYGLVISILIIFLFLIFDLILISIAINQNKKNKYLLTGIISILIFQQIQNIGMNLGLLPITGITLPFISYGGSSLICYLILIGLILNINKKKKEL